MAYGRDVQAEEILQDALKADPARAAIYVKLLEIYAQRRNNRQFEATASELFARTAASVSGTRRQAGRKSIPTTRSMVVRRRSPPVRSRRRRPGATRSPWWLGLRLPVWLQRLLSPIRPGPPPSCRANRMVKHDLAGLDFTTTSPVEPSHSQMRDTWTLPGDLSRIGSEAHEPGRPEPVVEEPAVEQVAVN